MISSCCKWLVPVASCSRREASTVANLFCSDAGIEDEVVDLVGPGLVDPGGLVGPGLEDAAVSLMLAAVVTEKAAVSLMLPAVVTKRLFAVVPAASDPGVGALMLPRSLPAEVFAVVLARSDPVVVPLVLHVVAKGDAFDVLANVDPDVVREAADDVDDAPLSCTS